MAAPAKRLLLLAYHFPPDTSIGAVRPTHFCRHLPSLGWEPHVITAAAQTAPPNPAIQSIADLYPEHNRGTLAWHKERTLRKLCFPGHLGIGWSRDASRCGIAWDAAQRRAGAQTAMLSSYPPLGVHLAALRIRRHTGIPWIADFRDPLGYDPTGIYSGLAHASQRWLERFIFARADLVIANTDAMAERWRSSYPQYAGKIHVIWNGYDSTDAIPTATPAPGPVRYLTHLGSLYSGRHPGAVAEGLAWLLDEGKVPPGSVAIRQIGPAAEEEINRSPASIRAHREGWLRLESSQPQAQAWRAAQESAILLLLQPQSDHQVPGKLFEYLRLGRPILAVVPRHSPIEAILSQSGVPYRCLHPDLPHQTSGRALLELLDLPAQHYAANDWFYGRFDAAARTRSLAALIESLMARRLTTSDRPRG